MKSISRQLSVLVFAGNSVLAQASMDQLGIEVRNSSREFAYTNKQDAFYYGETNGENTTSWQGFNVFGHEFLDDYIVLVDGKKLDRSQATTVVYPDYLKRIHPKGIIEELRLADSIPLFSVTITSSNKPVTVEIIPLVTDGTDPQNFVVGHREHALVLARRGHQKRTAGENYPVWLGVSGKDFEAVHTTRTMGGRFAPFSVKFGKSRHHTIAFAVGDESGTVDLLMQKYLGNQATYHSLRRNRMEQLLNDSWVGTENPGFNKALAWAKLSLDALIMNQVTKGIFAGLPWFNDYWGRDTFISLPGATLVQGRFPEAKQIIRSFAAFQQTDPSSTFYGRVPNRVTTTDTIYNTADGTPRCVIMAKEYVDRSGDTAFVPEIYPVVRRSIEGTLKYHCDSLGFLTHGDQETWMDAAGPDGPWSPRGNRANDIQGLWAQQLDAGIWFATRVGDSEAAQLWNLQLQKLRRNFPVYFLHEGTVADHLNTEGSPDTQLRPNQLFTAPLLDQSMRAEVLHSVTNNLAYEYGVSSLSQEDENFHPYHRYEPFYPKDAAYQNGIVWTWLQGSLISELCRFNRQEIAMKISENTVHQILDRGAVGTQSEVMDAVPRPGESEPRLSGTFSQAWNLAEFIRNFYDDYLGVNVSLLNHRLVIHPRLPQSLGNVKATINLNGRSLPIEVQRHADSTIILIDGRNLRKGGTGEIILQANSRSMVRTSFNVQPQSIIRYALRDTSVSVHLDGKKQTDITVVLSSPFRSPDLDSLQLATPKLREGLRALQGPTHPLLSHSLIKSTNRAAKLIFEVEDPAGDDKGTGAYEYPRNPAFVPDCLDVTRFKATSDHKNAYFELRFRALSNPGWHPEYGFQLTYVAIAIDEDSVKDSGQRRVGHNSSYTLNEERAFERLILVGGGVKVEDSAGNILAEYVPTEPDAANPLGDVTKGVISFAIPLQYLGKPDAKWRCTVLVGAQDDHGGAGLGEFRSVSKDVGEWNGGGKAEPSDPNVYDVLLAPTK